MKTVSIGCWLSKFLFRKRPRGGELLRKQLKEAARQAVLSVESLQMIEGILAVNESRVRDIMVPVPQMEFMPADADFPAVLEKVAQSQHSRYPVMEGEDVIGILFSKDLLVAISSQEKWNIRNVMRPYKAVPESQRLNLLLRDFRNQRQHMAVVIDEHNTVSGLITIEDILEQIVGEIHDEHDSLGGVWIINHGNQYTIKGFTPVTELQERIGHTFDTQADTIGGLLLEHFEHVPLPGERVTVGGCRFRILKADKKRIHLVSLKIDQNEGSGGR